MADDPPEQHATPATEPERGEETSAISAEKAATSEAALVERAKADPLAFGELYDAYYTRILNYTYRCTLNRSVAEELTSNTFFKAFRSLGTYAPRSPFSCWLYRIATNEVRMHWRKEKLRRLCGLGSASKPLDDTVYFVAPEVELREEQRAQVRRYARLHELLAELPVRYQAPLRLRFVERLPLDEIAQVLGKRLGTVKSLIHRGLARLRSRLERDATFPEDVNYREVTIGADYED